MQKRKYNINIVGDKEAKQKEVEGYTERLYLSNGLSITVGLRKTEAGSNDYWHIDDDLSGLAVTTQSYNTRKEALQEAKRILEIQKDNILQARDYFVESHNIKFNIL